MKFVIALMMVVACSACSTVAGLGKDITSGAEWTKEKIGGGHTELNR
jgi:predicted small secreted protein